MKILTARHHLTNLKPQHKDMARPVQVPSSNDNLHKVTMSLLRKQSVDKLYL